MMGIYVPDREAQKSLEKAKLFPAFPYKFSLSPSEAPVSGPSALG